MQDKNKRLPSDHVWHIFGNISPKQKQTHTNSLSNRDYLKESQDSVPIQIYGRRFQNGKSSNVELYYCTVLWKSMDHVSSVSENFLRPVLPCSFAWDLFVAQTRSWQVVWHFLPSEQQRSNTNSTKTEILLWCDRCTSSGGNEIFVTEWKWAAAAAHSDMKDIISHSQTLFLFRQAEGKSDHYTPKTWACSDCTAFAHTTQYVSSRFNIQIKLKHKGIAR